MKVQIITNDIRFNGHDVREFSDVDELNEYLEFLYYGPYNLRIIDVIAIEDVTFEDVNQLVIPGEVPA